MSNPFEQLQVLFSEMALRAASPEPVWEAVGSTMLQEAKEAFSERESPLGGSWSRLKPATLAIGKRGTGALKNSLRVSQEAGRLSLSSPLIYAAVQQFGNPGNRLFGTNKIAPIPARSFSPIEDGEVPPKVREAIDRVFEYIFLGDSE